MHIGGSGQYIKTQNGKYKSCEVNMFIMYHVHHLSTEMDGEPQKCLKAHLKILTKIRLYLITGFHVLL